MIIEQEPKDFGQNYSVITPIGEVELDYFQFDKIFDKKRERYFGLIKPTFEAPLLVVKHTDSLGFERELFIKTFLDKKQGILYFVSVAKNEDGSLQITSAHEKKDTSILKKIKEGSVTHKINALFPFLNGIPLSARLNTSKQIPTHYTTLKFGFPFTISKKKCQNRLQYDRQI